MHFSKTLQLLVLGSTLSYASTLAIYQDQTLYTYDAGNSYIGMTKGVKAKCEGSTLDLYAVSICTKDKRLCKELFALKEAQKKLKSIQYTTKELDKLSSLPQPTAIDAKAWIKAASYLGEEKASLLEKEAKSQETVNIKIAALKKQTPSQDVLVSEKICTKELALTLPYGYVTFSTFYEADIADEKELKVTQRMRIVNRSGIDIVADKAMFYYRRAVQYLRPVHFNPWIVSKYEARAKRRMMKKSMANAGMADEAMVSMSMQAAPVSVPSASYVDAREYRIDGLVLPSTGVPIDVEIVSWRVPLTCRTKAYPYMHTRAFRVCSFIPKYQIDSHTWKVTSGKEMLNENARGEYHEGKYELYTTMDEDIKISRKRLVNKERETGIFGGTVRKKDGFVLTLHNKSDKEKNFTVTERIPTSTTDEIKVKLLEIKSDKKIDYKKLKDGKIEMQIKLAAKESKKIEVLFEISYDKELKVRY